MLPAAEADLEWFAGVSGSNNGPVSLVLNGDSSKLELQLKDEVYVRFFSANIGFSGEFCIISSESLMINRGLLSSCGVEDTSGSSVIGGSLIGRSVCDNICHAESISSSFVFC